VSIQGFGPGFFGGGGGGAPSYGIQVLGYNYETVREIAEDLGRRLQRYPRIREVDTNSSSGWYSRERATEIVLRLDRARLALHGLSAADAVRQVASRVGAFSRQDVLRLGGEELGLLVRTGDSYAVDVRALEDLLIPAPGGGAVRLGAVGTLEEREVLGRIVRKDQQYERVVAYEFRGPVKLGDRVQNAVLETTRLPVGYSVARRAGWSWSSEEQRQIYAVLAAALVLVFMITAALFESLRQPMIVLLTVPMALVGVFAAFLLTGATFTREAFIGVIMMSGVVVNNAILLVDRVNGLRRGEGEGMALGDAVLRGTLERVRPILMTNATTILGMLPLVLFGDAADARIWNALTYALIGGLASAAVLVLTVTPALYLLFERRAAARAALSAAASTPSPTLSAAQ
jgi:HAE1 family hydrophobic/amphiphilic exporter-1